MFVGVDGCARGWVCVVIDASRVTDAALLPDFAAVRARFGDAAVLGVDIPIGLTDTAGRGADRCARELLQGQASSVFNAPPRAALAATSYAEAQRITRAQAGKGLSKQSYFLFDKIRQVDAFADDARIVEVHPEVSFRTMGADEPLPSKKTWGGLQARLARLADVGLGVPNPLPALDQAGIDDVLDATAAAWSARRVAAGTALRIGATPERDPTTGRAIAIWA